MADAIIKRHQWILEDTGEVIWSEEERMNFYLITEQGYLLYNNKPSVKVWTFREIPLAATDQAKLMQLLPFVGKGNALIRDDVSMSTAQVGHVIGLSRPRASSFLQRAQKAGVIRKVGNTYYVSPLYLMRGNRLSAQLYRIFEDQLAPELPYWVRLKLMETT